MSFRGVGYLWSHVPSGVGYPWDRYLRGRVSRVVVGYPRGILPNPPPPRTTKAGGRSLLEDPFGKRVEISQHITKENDKLKV